MFVITTRVLTYHFTVSHDFQNVQDKNLPSTSMSNLLHKKINRRRNFNSKFPSQRSLTNLLHIPVYTYESVDPSKTKGGLGFRRSELLFQGFVPRSSWQNPLRHRILSASALSSPSFPICYLRLQRELTKQSWRQNPRIVSSL